MRQILRILICCSILFASGCSSQTGSRSPLGEDQKPYQTKSLSILPFDVEAIDFPSGKRISEREPLIDKAFLAGLEKQLATQGITFNVLAESDFSEDQKDNLKESLTLWRVIMGNECARENCLGENQTMANYPLFSAIKVRDFSVGPEVALLDPNADLFLAVYIKEVLPTDEFKGNRTAREIGINLLLLPLVILSKSGYSEPRGGTYLAGALIDAKTGNVIWRKNITSNEVNLQDQDNVESWLWHLLRVFPSDQLQSN